MVGVVGSVQVWMGEDVMTWWLKRSGRVRYTSGKP